MSEEPSTPMRGRPPKAGEGKRASFNTRLRNTLKQELEAAAQASGRSLSEEIEARLERSFDRERTFHEALTSLFGGPRTEAILLTLAISANRGEAHIGDRWLDDYATFNTVMNEWRRHLDRIPVPAMPDETKAQVEMLKRIIRSLDPRQAAIEQTQPQHWLKVADFTFSHLALDPETAAEIERDLAKVKSQIDNREVRERAVRRKRAAPEGDDPAE